MRISTHVLSLLIGLVASSAVACSAETTDDKPSEGATDVSDLTGSISQADLDEAARLADTSMFVVNPKLSRRAAAKAVTTSDFDGTRSSTYVVKDVDGRLFHLYAVTSNPEDSTLQGRHGAPPAFSDARYFLLLNKPGIDWAVKTFRTVGSTRHDQILEALADQDYPDDVKLLGDTAAGQKIVWFNSSVFLVSGDGMSDRCKSLSANCSALWQRINNWRDPFDAR